MVIENRNLMKKYITNSEIQLPKEDNPENPLQLELISDSSHHKSRDRPKIDEDLS